MEEFDKKITEMDSEIKRLQKEKLLLEMMDISQKNALILHEKFCTFNHTDGCGWLYEIKNGVHDWNGLSHKSWLKKAQLLIHAGYHISDVEVIKNIMG